MEVEPAKIQNETDLKAAESVTSADVGQPGPELKASSGDQEEDSAEMHTSEGTLQEEVMQSLPPAVSTSRASDSGLNLSEESEGHLETLLVKDQPTVSGVFPDQAAGEIKL